MSPIDSTAAETGGETVHVTPLGFSGVEMDETIEVPLAPMTPGRWPSWRATASGTQEFNDCGASAPGPGGTRCLTR
jgi:hypothetical protein